LFDHPKTPLPTTRKDSRIVPAITQKVKRRRLPQPAKLTEPRTHARSVPAKTDISTEIPHRFAYEHLIIEDKKPAGFEPVDVRSGYNGNPMGAYVEFRDERVCFFLRTLACGTHSISYRTRAEIPGDSNPICNAPMLGVHHGLLGTSLTRRPSGRTFPRSPVNDLTGSQPVVRYPHESSGGASG
jgi:hypothetical protein